MGTSKANLQKEEKASRNSFNDYSILSTILSFFVGGLIASTGKHLAVDLEIITDSMDHGNLDDTDAQT